MNFFHENKTLNDLVDEVKDLFKKHPFFATSATIFIIISFFLNVKTIPTLKDEISFKNEQIDSLKEEINQKDIILSSFRTIIAMEGFSGTEIEQFKKLIDKYTNLEKEFEIYATYKDASKLEMSGCAYPSGVCLSTKLTELLLECVKTENKKSSLICNDKSIEKFKEVIEHDPTFPFAYYGLAYCLLRKNDDEWKSYAEKALKILNITTSIQGHTPQHDEAKARIENLLKKHKAFIDAQKRD